MSERKPGVFISYSHKDEEWKNRLVRQLQIPAEQHGFEVWHDGQIQVGDDWRERIGAALESTEIAVLLISDEFLNSDFIKKNEVPLLLDLRQQGRVEIVPLLVGACLWKSVAWLERLELRPKDGEPLESLSIPAHKKALVQIAGEIDAKLTQAVKRAERGRAGARGVVRSPAGASQVDRAPEQPIAAGAEQPQEQPGRALAGGSVESPPVRPDPPKPAAAPPAPHQSVVAQAARTAVPSPVVIPKMLDHGNRQLAVPSWLSWTLGVTALALGVYLWVRAQPPPRAASETTPSPSVAPTSQPASAPPAVATASPRTSPVIPVPGGSPPLIRVTTFEFGTVRVDARGSVLERKRQSAKFYEEDLGGGVKLPMVAIPGGEFVMGSPGGEAGRFDDEGSQRTVSVAPFFMGKFEVTQAQWRAVARWPQVARALAEAPSRFKGDDLPVEQVSWHDAVEFCARLSRRTGRAYRLPSEAEWEYAARAGTKTATYAGAMEILGQHNAPALDEIAWYGGNSGVGFERADGWDSSSWSEKQYPHSRAGTRVVGSKSANPWGLYDTLGNVLEWVEDDWHGSYKGAPIDGRAWAEPTRGSARVIRGGSWYDYAWDVRAAYRGSFAPDARYGTLGFRCARVQE